MKKWILTAFFLSAGSLAHADNPAFDQLTEAQAKNVIKEFSANFAHTSVSGAGTLGDVFGVEVGLIAGVTKSDEISSLTKQADPGSDFDQMPHGGILAMVSVPLGFTFEGSLIPEIGGEDFKFKNMGLAAKWTVNSIHELPVLLAVKAHVAKTNLSFKQTVSAVQAEVDVETTVTGLMFLASKRLTLVEPYLGLGFLSGDGAFDVEGSNQFFQTGASTYSAKESGTQIVAGVEANLLFLKAGAEYVNNFGASGFNLKVAFSF